MKKNGVFMQPSKAVLKPHSSSYPSNLIKMSFTSESLTISSAMVDLGRSISEKIDCSCSEDIEIGFSHKFFKTCVDTIETNDVTITLSDKTRAVLVMPTDGSYKALCMPMKID